MTVERERERERERVNKGRQMTVRLSEWRKCDSIKVSGTIERLARKEYDRDVCD